MSRDNTIRPVVLIATSREQWLANVIEDDRYTALHGLIAPSSQPLAAGPSVQAGYDAVANFTYTPIDPVDLVWRSRAALRRGVPEPGHPWVRHYDGSATAATQDGSRPIIEEGRKRI